MLNGFSGVYRGKRVLVTGHTGFKGAWLSEWLLALGAEVSGLSLEPGTEPSLFHQLHLASRMGHHLVDIRDPKALQAFVHQFQPEYVFHLAAQSLVRLSYQAPVATYETNVLGTLHLLEALRTLEKPCPTILVTTDKCYENKEWHYGYRESDPLGGHDPYSASKAAAEILISSHRRSFFHRSPVRLASARAGNVIGGGDWALDRIVPDAIRALSRKESILVRHPTATRPWQHVLEPLSGYLWLAASMTLDPDRRRKNELEGPFNFGPGHDANRQVSELVESLLAHWPGKWEKRSDSDGLHEAQLLQLTTDKAHRELGWFPVWNFQTAVTQTVTWYRFVHENAEEARPHTLSQLREYSERARTLGLAWAL